METFPEKVHQYHRDIWEKWEAKKRKGIEINLDELEEQEHAAEKSGPLQRILLEISQQRPTWESSARVADLDLKQAYQKIIDRYGEKAQRFLEALKKTGWARRNNIKEASEMAQISRPTAYKYLREFALELEKSVTAKEKRKK